MSLSERSSVSSLRDRPQADVLVIGGGINGISIFRDLALQGVDVALVEKADYTSGASAASSHMVHGGVRYLENGELRLVKESVAERNGLLRTAPHLVRPLPTVIPIFSTFSGLVAAPLRMLRHGSLAPKERGALLIKMGLTLYDSFSRGGGLVPRHVFEGRKQSLSERPEFPTSLRYTATYYDASVNDPERLALDVLRDGIGASTVARASNYVSAVRASGDAVVLRDETSGVEFEFSARVVVNASGPWTDLTNESLGSPTEYMGGTKGSHIVLDNPSLLRATRGSEIFFENSDGRIVLIYPLRDRVMVGTTDIPADPRQPARCTEEEIDYFFELVRKVFPAVEVNRSQIVYRFSGIRPLPRGGDLAAGLISRDYRVVPGRIGSVQALSVVGGKYTTFRALGERVADDVLAILGRERIVYTRALPIGGGVDFPVGEAALSQWVSLHGPHVGEGRARLLLSRYGTRAADYLAVQRAPEQPLSTVPSYTREELTWLVRSEQVVDVLDLAQRRTSIAMSGRLTEKALRELVEITGDALNWDDGARDDSYRNAQAYLADRHGLDLGAIGAQP